MHIYRSYGFVIYLVLIFFIAGCGLGGGTRDSTLVESFPPRQAASPEEQKKAREVVIFALNLQGIGYRFGGKNPEAGFDCSGMVNYVFSHAINQPMTGNAATIARRGHPVNRSELRPGDLVFFNTSGRSFSHVGLYIGDDRFIHAPSSRGQVRIDSLRTGYFAERYQAARSYF